MAKEPIMQLNDYLAERRLTPTAFAESIGVPASTITRILRRQRRPTVGTIAKIEAATEGKVSFVDFLPERAA